MGNYASCFYNNTPKTAKLLDYSHNLRQVKVPLPLKAAHLMLEKPGHVVSHLHQLQRTRCLTALRAEDELSAGNIYLLLPLSKLHCKISESEMMRIIESACAKTSTKRKRGAKVLPAVRVEAESSGVEVEVDESGDASFTGCRFGNHRPWTPVLEPILEES